MDALTSLVKCNLTAEVFRSLSLFITYAFHQPSGAAARTPNKVQAGTVQSRSVTVSGAPKRPIVNTLFEGNKVNSTIFTKRQLGNKVLEMYTGLLCEKGSTTNIKKFARTVTNKVILTRSICVYFADIGSGSCTF
jgi:beige protein homolog 1